MKTNNYKFQVMLLCTFLLFSCEDYLEVESPDNKIITETVFNSDETAVSAMKGIYNQLSRASFSGGGTSSVTLLSSLSTDELQATLVNDQTYKQFEENEILPANPRNNNLWVSAYNMIYMVNALLDGLQNSEEITEEIRDQLTGEAKFVRAFTYFYLVNLYGEVPLVLSTEYSENALTERDTKELINGQIIADLQASINLLTNEYSEGERFYVNRLVATAFLARVHLYKENWDQAELLSSEIIEQTETFELLEDLDSVFLANSKEAIWQISPEGDGGSFTHTNEGATFIFHPIIASLTPVKLSGDFVLLMEGEDERLINWVGYHQSRDDYSPYKYKIRSSSDPVSEYSMVLRLAEQYLIRSEARLMEDDIAGAIADLDIIRKRAGLELIAETNLEISKEALIDSIFKERKKELFTEWGHRWLDLKRTEKATEKLASKTSYWEETDVLYPIPEEERIKNPNLTQNAGY